MNISSRSILLAVAAFCLPFAATSFAQPPAAAEKSAPAAPTAPTPPAETGPAATTPPAPAPVTPVESAPVSEPRAAETSADDRPKMRRLDDPDAPVEAPRPPPRRRSQNRGASGEFPFGDHTVPKGGRIQDLVSIMGSNLVEGTVSSDAVSIGGDTLVTSDGSVGGGAVAVLGQLDSQGTIRQQAVSVLGGMKINGYVGDQAVAVLGNMHLGPNAVIDGDVVVVGGKLTKEPGAVVNGNEVRVPVLGAVGSMEWLTAYLKRCVFYGRPLAFGPHLGWAWAVAFSFFAFYLLLALLFPQGIVKCAETLETRPGFSVLSSVLTVMLSPVVTVLLAITVVGALLVPFLGAGLFFAGLFGKAVMLAWIGRRFTKFFGDGPLGLPVFAVLIGGFIVLMLYTIPVLGFLSYKLLSWLGLGVVVYTIARSMKRARPATVAAGGASVPAVDLMSPPGGSAAESFPVPLVAQASSPVATGPTDVPLTSAGFSGQSSGVMDLPPVPEPGPAPMPPPVSAATSFTPPVPPSTPPPTAAATEPRGPASRPLGVRPPTMATATVWPRAGFFIRLGALALDGVLIGLIMAFLHGLLPRFLHFHDGPGGWFIALAIYGAIMWKLKGTTIGGIVCGLKVVRVDNRALDWPTAVVRALACFLSLAVAGLGFIWVAIDDEKQSWHDKIAGTAVVMVPKGVSLV
jgi:uncharacterized RDD family membrane protein YckC